jgi:hypothetical protein
MSSLRCVLLLAMTAVLAAGAALAQQPSANGPVIVGTRQDNAKPQTPPPVMLGTYHCHGFWNANLESLSFRLINATDYSSLSGKSRGTWELKDNKIRFTGGHLDGEVGDRRWQDAIKLGVETCTKV